SIRDWSSDVCSSDLFNGVFLFFGVFCLRCRNNSVGFFLHLKTDVPQPVIPADSKRSGEHQAKNCNPKSFHLPFAFFIMWVLPFLSMVIKRMFSTSICFL